MVIPSLPVPRSLAASCAGSTATEAWLQALPAIVHELVRRWRLDLGAPFETATAAWVAPDRRRPVVLKVGMPHFEARDEIAGMLLWDGGGAARVLRWDDTVNALLLERCEPGTSLGDEVWATQDTVIASLLRRLWRTAFEPSAFRRLSDLTTFLSKQCRRREDDWPDSGLVREGLREFEELSAWDSESVLLATDLHAGNVLAAEREPWLVIDPKPFVGDPAFDLTQHLLNCRPRLHADPVGTCERVSELSHVSAARVRRWLRARLAVEAWNWSDADWPGLIRRLS